MALIDRMLLQREVSGLPISVATSLAIETACGVNPLIPMERAPILDYDRLFINVRTLARNVHGALSTDVKKIVKGHEVAATVMEEMTIIDSAITQASNGRCSVSYYACSLEGLRREFKFALLKIPTTDIQKQYHDYEQQAWKQTLVLNRGHDVRRYDVGIKDHFNSDRTLLLSHIPLDLLSRSRFADLQLLESHTGSIKGRAEWHTKLTGGKELNRIPFNRITMQIFGDNNQIFGAMSPKTKEAVRLLAEDKLWTRATTEEKVISDLGRIPDPQLRAQLLMLVS